MVTVGEMSSIDDLDAGVPVLPLRRTFVPGGGGGGGGFTGGVPVLPLRRAFIPPGGFGGGVPVPPLRRAFIPPGGFGDFDDLGQLNGFGPRWAIVDANGSVIAVVHGRPRRLSAGYGARRAHPGENFQHIPKYVPSGTALPAASQSAMSELGEADTSLF